MGFTVRGPRDVKTGISICGPYKRYLSIFTWQCNALCPTILVDCSTPNDSPDRIAVTQSISKRFNQERRCPFSSSVSGRSLIMTVATALRRKESVVPCQLCCRPIGVAEPTESG